MVKMMDPILAILSILDLQNGQNNGPYAILSILGYWAIILGALGGPGRSTQQCHMWLLSPNSIMAL